MTYVLITSAGINLYFENDNWFLAIICITFLFQGEKIIRAIFGMQGPVNTLGDLATTAGTIMALAKSPSKLFKRDKKEKDKEEPHEEMPEDNAYLETTGDSSDSSTARLTRFNLGAARNAVMQDALKARKHNRGKGIVKAAKTVAGATGILFGATLGMAKGNIQSTISNAYAGKELGRGMASLASAIPLKLSNKIINTYKGKKLKRATLRGENDERYGIKEITDEEIQKRMRKALAKTVSKATRAGELAGDVKLSKEMKKI